MARSEAISILERVAHTESKWPGTEDTLEALDMAISALRQQECVGDVNKSLTLDELRQMDGEPVWVQSPGVPEYGRWAIVEGVGWNCLFLRDDFTCHDYGKTWLAYRHKPEEGTV